MNALITTWWPLKYMSAAHKLSAPGRLYMPANGLQQCTKRGEINRLDIPGKPENKGSAINARVHLFARRGYSQALAAKLDAAIAANLKELGYGG